MTAARRFRRGRGSFTWHLVAVGLASLALGAEPVRAEERDYLPDHQGWNGMSRLADLATRRGRSVTTADRLDLGSVRPDRTALLLLSPRHVPPTEALLAFVRQGGRILVADDFGQAGPLLSRLGISRPVGAPTEARRWHEGNRHLPLALPGPVSHSLTRGVESVVANHPAYFVSRLPTLLGFGAAQQLLVAGEVGRGRIVALSDPSVLINAMLEFPGNLRLAENLVDHLLEGRVERLVVLVGRAQLEGRVADAPTGEAPASAEAGQRLNDFLSRVNDFALTPAGLRSVVALLALVLVAALALLLPLPRRPLEGHWVRPGAPRPHRFALTGAARGAASASARAAAMLRDEVEDRLTEFLQLPAPVSTVHARWVAGRLERRAGPEAARLASRLLSDLRKVPYTAHGPEPGATRAVSSRELARLYEQSRRLFALCGDESLPDLRSPRDHVHPA
ncbi:MAG: DUF4350 domain-containing protein [Deltaproteobacteria bacterium]|nr:DUF4350 domain-containing protein [Deltaproteobacteria bacterium]